MNPSLDFQFFFFVFFTSELIICDLFYAPGGKLNVQHFNMNSSVTWNHRSAITSSWLSRKSKNPLSIQMNLWLVLPPYLSERNVTKPVDVMLIKIFIAIKFIVRLSSRLSINFLWKLQSSQLCTNFPWSAVLKNFDLVSITDSFGNHGTNIRTVLQRSRIHDLNLLDQWVGEMQNLSGLINTIKNSPLN